MPIIWFLLWGQTAFQHTILTQPKCICPHCPYSLSLSHTKKKKHTQCAQQENVCIMLVSWQCLVYLNMCMVFRYVLKGRQALAEPHGDISFHVDSEGLKTFLEATHGIVLKSTGVLAQVHASYLGHAQTTHRDEAWGGGGCWGCELLQGKRTKQHVHACVGVCVCMRVRH